jgi:nucleotide-binding universal stress UspA family protein
MNALIVIDEGTESEQALDRAYDLLADQQGTLTPLHVIPGSPFYGTGLPCWDDWDDLAAEYARSKALLDEGARHLRERGARFTIRIESAAGDPEQVIVRTAEEDNAAVIILSSRLGATDPPATSSRRSDETCEPAQVTEERQLALV